MELFWDLRLLEFIHEGTGGTIKLIAIKSISKIILIRFIDTEYLLLHFQIFLN